MTIAALIDYLAGTFLPSVAITSPQAAEIQHVYKLMPDSSRMIDVWPSAILNYELQGTIFHPNFLERQYAVHVQLLVAPVSAGQQLASEMAVAFDEALALALSDEMRLGGNVSVVRGYHSDSPDAIVRLTWGGASFVGLDVYLDVTLKTGKVHSA